MSLIDVLSGGLRSFCRRKARLDRRIGKAQAPLSASPRWELRRVLLKKTRLSAAVVLKGDLDLSVASVLTYFC